MKTLICASGCALLWLLSGPAIAQTDALVVDDTGRVGVSLAAPNENITVTVARGPAFDDEPRRCSRDVPVRIVIQDAISGAILLTQQGFLTQGTRVLTAVLPPAGESGRAVQVGVLTRASLTPCIVSDIAAIGPGGIRRLVPDG